MSIITIKNEKITVDISTTAAEMQSIKANGKEYLWNGDPKFWGRRAPALFPICGSLKDDKYLFDGKFYSLNQHGFAKFSEFSVVDATDVSAEFSLCANEETLKNYPFNFDLRIKYTLNEQSIEIEYKVINNDNKDMYFSIGSHEGYMCEEGFWDYTLEFEKNEDLISADVDGSLLCERKVNLGENVRELKLSNELFDMDSLIFLNLNSKSIKLKNDNKCLRVDFKDFEALLIWTVKNSKYVCIEPWCGIPDYTTSDYDFTKKKGIIKLAPNNSSTRTHTITIEK
ncbi:MAG: aldose 1-epimerase family protein [Clostridia bacterium]|nr:aldose 1-epimerase family protein [Clostridia bacterium]